MKFRVKSPSLKHSVSGSGTQGINIVPSLDFEIYKKCQDPSPKCQDLCIIFYN